MANRVHFQGINDHDIEIMRSIDPRTCKQAIYKTSPIPEFRGNPCIETLPDILSSADLTKALWCRPHYDEDERKQPTEYREYFLYRLNKVYVPLTLYHSISQTIHQTIRIGYLHRNLRDPAFNQYLYENEARMKNLNDDLTLSENEPLCDSFSLIGTSALGKTRILKRTLEPFDPLIWHPEFKRYQIPYLLMETPVSGGPKQIAENFFIALDKIIPSDYSLRHNKSESAGALIMKVNALIHLYSIGIVLSDEIQHAGLAAGSNGTHLLMNSFVTLANSGTAPFVWVGTPAALDFMCCDLRHARRLLGLFLKNLDPGREWDYFLKKIWKYQWTRNPTPLTKGISDAMYDRTQGILGLAVRLYQFSQQLALSSGEETLSAKMINDAADERLKMCEPMIKALKSGDPDEIRKYGDLKIPDYVPGHYNKDQPGEFLSTFLTAEVGSTKPTQPAKQ